MSSSEPWEDETFSELSGDEYSYDNYAIEFYEDNDGPPLIKKKSRLLMAAVQNDVESLRTLLDSPKWYKVRDNYGYNLLHITILRESKEAFDYLLSLDDFPFEAVSSDGCTAVMVALSGYVSNDIFMEEHYAYELVKKGVDIDKLCMENNTLLHCALDRDFVRVARLLIEKGVDVNVQNDVGDTPLHMCYYCNEQNANEMINMLLCYGADPFICNSAGHTPFSCFMKWHHKEYLTAQESLLNFTMDQWRRNSISASVLFQVANQQSPLFKQIVDFSSGITFDCELDLYCIIYLFVMDSKHLELLLEKFPSTISEILQCHSTMSFSSHNFDFCWKNLDIISQTFSSEFIDYVSNINSSVFIENLINNYYSSKSTKEIIEIILYLLSYGMVFHETDFQIIYKQTGYSEDFKIFLYLDAQKQIDKSTVDIMPRLICDINLDVQNIVEDLALYDDMDWDVLFGYFAHPKLQQAYQHAKGYEFEGTRLRQLPLLQELARDAFRKHFIKVFQIKSTKEFFTLIRLLPVSSVYKKIVTFEKKLYNNY